MSVKRKAILLWVVILTFHAQCAEFTLNIQPGWNVFSLPIVPDNGIVETLFSDTTVSRVAAWDGRRLRTTGSLSYGGGYVAYATAAHTVTITGELAPPELMFIDLRHGWNFVGNAGEVLLDQPSVKVYTSKSNTYQFARLTEETCQIHNGLWVFSGVANRFPIPTRTISGTIIGESRSNIEVRLGGAISMTTQTDDSGNYLFSGLPPSVYSVTPIEANTLFTPPQHRSVAACANDAIAHFDSLDGTLDTSFLQLQAPGTYVINTDALTVLPTFRDLSTETELQFCGPEQILLAPLGTTISIDELAITDPVSRISGIVVENVSINGVSRIRLKSAPLTNLLNDGASFTTTLTPDWQTAAAAGSEPLFDDTGTLQLETLLLASLFVDDDGLIERATSTINGRSLTTAAALTGLNAVELSQGETTIEIVNGQIRMAPTLSLSWTRDGDEIDITGVIDADIELSLTLAATVPGPTTLRLNDELRSPVTIQFDNVSGIPTYVDLELSLPWTLDLTAQTSGAMTTTMTSRHSVHSTITFGTTGPFLDTTDDHQWSTPTIDINSTGPWTVSMSIAPTMQMAVNGLSGPTVWTTLGLRCQSGQSSEPIPSVTAAAFAGISLESDNNLLNQLVGTSALLFRQTQHWFFGEPTNTPTMNTPPVLSPSLLSRAQTRSTFISLIGSDTDDDLLTFNMTATPHNGNVIAFDAVSGRFNYRPLPDFFGNDFLVAATHDGQLASAPDNVAINVVASAPPRTYFRADGNGFDVTFDASLSMDDRDTDSLEVRWDFEADGIWDSEWTPSLTTAHTYSHSGSRIAICQAKDADGLTTTAKRLLDITASDSWHFPIPVLAVTTDGLSINVDGSGSSDDDPGDTLMYRWDYDDDGVFDTDWQFAATSTYTYAGAGAHHVILQARDTSGNIASTGVDVLIAAPTGTTEQYVVIDLSAGATAQTYPIVVLDDLPEDALNDHTYRTTTLLFRRLPAGRFGMGSPTDEVGRFSDGESRHLVSVTTPFYIGVFEITQQQWLHVLGDSPSFFIGDTRPVEQVSWNAARGGTWPNGNADVSSFVGRLRQRTGLDLDLPTEAQWEYAARAGSVTALNVWENLISIETDRRLNGVGRYWSNGGSDYLFDMLNGGTTAVGNGRANAWGLYDMHGNVREWCLDWHITDLGTDEVTDPPGPDSGVFKTTRGGSWLGTAAQCRAAARQTGVPEVGELDVGLRLIVRATVAVP